MGYYSLYTLEIIQKDTDKTDYSSMCDNDEVPETVHQLIAEQSMFEK